MRVALNLERATLNLFWLGLQMDYDLDTAEDEIGDQIAREVVVLEP